MMNSIFSKIQAMRIHFGWDRTDTIEFMSKQVLEESEELVESLNESEEAFQKELADVLMYALSICIDKGYDPETIIEEKIAEVMQREY